MEIDAVAAPEFSQADVVWIDVETSAYVSMPELILKGQKLGFTPAEIAHLIDARNGRATREALRLMRQKCVDQIVVFEERINDALAAVAELRRIHTALCCQ